MIKWFFHVAIMDFKSKEIVDEILNYIDSSGLLSVTDELHIWVIWWTIKINNPKIIIHNCWNNLWLFEFPTLKILQKECKNNPEMFVYYLHTKWASSPFDEDNIKWRRDMLKCIVNNYKLCIDKLSEFDTVWTRLLMEKDWQYPRHYSWNFRRSKASHINTLPSFVWKENDRYWAERWLMSNKNLLYFNMEKCVTAEEEKM